jgi:N-acetylneuraminic acid mutarotase
MQRWKKMKKCLIALFMLAFAVLFMANGLVVMAQGGSGNCWFEKAPMPTERFSFGTVVVNGQVYAIGGSYSKIHADQTYYSEMTNATEVYDPSTNTWTTKAPMLTARSDFAIVACENKIYAFGGKIPGKEIASSQLTNVTEAYDPATDTWTTKTSMPKADSDFSANVVDGKIYLIGAQTQVYDPANDSWTTKTPVPVVAADYASAVMDNKIYVIGGRTRAAIDLTQIYDPKTDVWTTGKSLPIAVTAAAAGATTGVLAPKAIYVFGGITADDPLHGKNYVQVYFPENDSWRTGTSMPNIRASLGVVVVDDAFYAIGGGMEIFVPNSDTNYLYIPVGYQGLIPTGPSLTSSPWSSSSSSTPTPAPSIVPTTIPTPSLTQEPAPTPTSAASPMPTSSPIPNLTLSPNPTSTTPSSASEQQQSAAFPVEYIYASAVAAAVVLIAVGVFFLRKKQ